MAWVLGHGCLPAIGCGDCATYVAVTRRCRSTSSAAQPIRPIHTMSQAPYDLAIIGSGPAGQKAALTAAQLGRRVAIIDRAESVGGVCIHTGTIPSKAIREAVLHLTGLRERSVYGDSYTVKQDITMADLLHRAHH